MSENLVSAPSPGDLYRAGHLLTDLLPCPFCGSGPLTMTELHPTNGNAVISINCPGRGLAAGCVRMVICCRQGEEEQKRLVLAERWNTRSAAG